LGLNRRLNKAIQEGLRGEHQGVVDQLSNQLPNFIIIGAAKSATTTLTTILPRHPDFFISRPKEPKFFGRRYDLGWQWYGSLFKRAKKTMLRGEGSTMYTSDLSSFTHAPELMHRYLPGLKLVYVVRHPLERLESQWRHRKGRKKNTPDFDAMLRSRHLRKLVLGCSLYNERLQPFRRLYPDSQIHCLTFEELIQNPGSTLTSLLTFLGARTQPRFLNLLLDEGRLPQVNEAGDKGRSYIAKPTWSPQLRQRVTDIIRPDAESILTYMGRPLNTWQWQEQKTK